MILEIIIFIITTLVVYFIYSYKRLHKYFEQKDVKYVPGLPVFGNVMKSTFLKRHIWDDLKDVYTAYPDEKYVGFLEFMTPIIFIRDPELIRSITIKDFDHFTDHRDFVDVESNPLFAGSLIIMKAPAAALGDPAELRTWDGARVSTHVASHTKDLPNFQGNKDIPSGEKWRDMRTTLSPAFTASKMKLIMPIILENTNNILEYLDENQCQEIDVDDLIRRYTNDVIASAGFGLQVNSLKEKNNEFFKIGSTISEFTFWQQILIMYITLFPKLAKKTKTRVFPDELYNFFTNIVVSTMEYRKKEKVERPDMIQLLMETPKEWTPDEIVGQVFIFFAAGFETSASALVMTIHELALNLDVQDKLYNEIKNFSEKQELTFDNLSELKYLDCVLNETLRIWSPALILDRICVKTFELPPPREGGKPYVLNPGDIVYNMVNCLHMDPKHFPDPEIYDPERFSDENKHKIKPFTYMPFGSGPRNCIGMRFAMLELKVLIFHILLKYKIVKSEKTTDPIKLRPHSFIIKASDGTWVKFEKRVQ